MRRWTLRFWRASRLTLTLAAQSCKLPRRLLRRQSQVIPTPSLIGFAVKPQAGYVSPEFPKDSKGGPGVPVISMFYGIIVMMYYFDDRRHHRAHIQVECGDEAAVITIPDGAVIEGSIRSAKLRLVQAWIEDSSSRPVGRLETCHRRSARV